MNPTSRGQLMKDLLDKDSRQVVCVIPDTDSFPSGGNIYNRRLIDQLLEAGIAVFQIAQKAPENEILFEQADMLMLDSLYLSPTYQWFWDQYPQTEKVIIFHHLDCLELKEGPAQKMCFKKYADYFKLANKVLVTSGFSKKWLQRQAVSPEKIWVIQPQVNWKIATNERQKKDSFTALLVGNLIPRKGILPFLQSLDQALAEALPFEIQIAGSEKLDPDYATACKQAVSQSRHIASRISFLGEIPPEDMPDLYQRADVLISASSMETFGMALQEAQFFGLPILALGSKESGGNIASFFKEEGDGKLCRDLPELVENLLAWVSSH